MKKPNLTKWAHWTLPPSYWQVLEVQTPMPMSIPKPNCWLDFGDLGSKETVCAEQSGPTDRHLFSRELNTSHETLQTWFL